MHSIRRFRAAIIRFSLLLPVLYLAGCQLVPTDSAPTTDSLAIADSASAILTDSMASVTPAPLDSTIKAAVDSMLFFFVYLNKYKYIV